MTKLYFSPGACSLAAHIALREAHLEISLARVNLGDKTCEGKDFNQINPKGYVPALQLPDGKIMTEVAAIIQWAADQSPDLHLLPAWGTAQRYTAIEWIGFLSTEIHKGYGPLWQKNTPPDVVESTRLQLQKRLQYLNTTLRQQPYLMGETYSVVDAYLFTLLNWAPWVKLDLSPFPALLSFQERIKARPAVQEALAAEGLGK